jgi:hypothetical protein
LRRKRASGKGTKALFLARLKPCPDERYSSFQFSSRLALPSHGKKQVPRCARDDNFCMALPDEDVLWGASEGECVGGAVVAA